MPNLSSQFEVERNKKRSINCSSMWEGESIKTSFCFMHSHRHQNYADGPGYWFSVTTLEWLNAKVAVLWQLTCAFYLAVWVSLSKEEKEGCDDESFESLLLVIYITLALFPSA